MLFRTNLDSRIFVLEEKGAWESGGDEDGGSHSSVLFGSSFRPKLLDLERERRACLWFAIAMTIMIVPYLCASVHAEEGAPEKLSCRFSTRYLTTHKGSVRCARFSYDGAIPSEYFGLVVMKLTCLEPFLTYRRQTGGDRFGRQLA